MLLPPTPSPSLRGLGAGGEHAEDGRFPSPPTHNDPYGAGWLFKVAAESEGPLLSAQEYASKNGGNLDGADGVASA